jgi:serine/threonine protein kinase/tetratricopeptide (TPR) repeat protein
MKLEGPSLLGAFKLQRLIRKGGMGEVWRGIHTDQGVPVAIKVMTGRRARNQKYIAAFRNEVESVARLDHPGVVIIFDHGNVSREAAAATNDRLVAGSPYLVMELASHGALDRLRRTLGWSELKLLLMGLLDALAHAHARGVVHRDLKPSNVLMSGPTDARPGMKLTDFGLAHALDSQREGTRESRAGTPRYMAPELFEGRFRDYGPWTDLYALGCMTYELITRQPMFPGTTSESLRRQHLYDEAPSIGPLNSLPPDFDSWLHRLVEKKPHARFQCASDAAWALVSLGDPVGWSPQDPTEIPAGADPDQVMASLANASTTTLLLPDPTLVHSVLHTQDPLAFVDTMAPSYSQSAGSTHLMPRIHAVTNVTTNFLSDTRSGISVELRVPTTPTEATSSDRPRLMDRRRPPVPLSWHRGTAPAPSMPLIGAGLSLFGLRTVRMVNRDRERDQLWEGLLAVQESNRARLVLLTGDAGVGKSRLVQWTSERAHEVGAAHVLKAVHGPFAGHTHGLAHMFARHLRCSGLSRPELRRHLRRLLQECWQVDQDYEWDALTELIAPPTAGGKSARAKVVRFSNPGERYAVYRRYLDRLGTDRPVVLWLDDVHYGSDALWFAQYLLRAQEFTPSPILILATARSDLLAERTMESHIVQQLLGLDEATRIEVGPLGPVAHSELVLALLGLESKLAAEVEVQTNGNPLFATELVGSWVKEELLEVGERGFVLREGASAKAPSSVAELWATRITNILGDSPVLKEASAAVELAAVLGLRVDANEWEAACEHAGIALTVDVFFSLVAEGLAVPDGEWWRFAHDLIRQNLVARAKQHGRWVRLNDACAKTLLGRYPRSTRGIAERIGRHLSDANRHGEALAPLLEGAEALIAGSEYRHATQLVEEFERCLKALSVPSNDQRWGRGRLIRARVLRLTGRFDEAFSLAEELVSIGWLHEWDNAEPLFELGAVAIERGDLAFAGKILTQALSLYRAAGKAAGQAQCSTALGQVAAESGDLTLATTLLRRALMQYERLDDRMGVAHCLYRLWRVVLQRGDLPLASSLLDQALALNNKLGHGLGVARCTSGLGRMALTAGLLSVASDRLQEAMELFASLDAMPGIADCLIGLAVVARRRGDHEVALVWCERALALQESTGTGDVVDTRLHIAITRLSAGEVDAAQRELLDVAQSAAQEGRRTVLARTHAALLLASARRQVWEDWGVHLGEVERLTEATRQVGSDLADTLQIAGETAIEAGRADLGRGALEIALGQWWELRDRERTAQVRKQIDTI